MSAMSMKQFETKLEGAVKATEKVKPILHELALFALSQNLLHGNITPASHMLDKLPTSINKRGLAQWLVEFGQFKIKEGAVSFLKSKTKQEKVEQQLASADAMPFWEFSKHDEGEVKPTNYQNLLIGLIAKAKREAKAGKQIIGLELLETVEAGLSDTVREEITKRALKETK